MVEQALVAEGLELLHWRLVPVGMAALGDVARANAPAIEQAVFRVANDADVEEAGGASGPGGGPPWPAAGRGRPVPGLVLDPDGDLQGAVRRRPTRRLLSRSGRGGLRGRLRRLPPALLDQHRALLGHAQPFRFLCHNGEINTIDGNVAWMRAREGSLGAALAEEDLLRPVLDPDGSDSAKLDNAVELLVRGGRDLRHALAMLVPAVEPTDEDDRQDLRDFYRYHACWPSRGTASAGLVFTDGRLVGAAWTATGCGPCAGRRPRTAWSSARRGGRPGRHRRPWPGAAGAGSGQARCCASTPSRGCSPTRSRASWPPADLERLGGSAPAAGWTPARPWIRRPTTAGPSPPRSPSASPAS